MLNPLGLISLPGLLDASSLERLREDRECACELQNEKDFFFISTGLNASGCYKERFINNYLPWCLEYDYY
jgi:hypothetical protein